MNDTFFYLSVNNEGGCLVFIIIIKIVIATLLYYANICRLTVHYLFLKQMYMFTV